MRGHIKQEKPLMCNSCSKTFVRVEPFEKHKTSQDLRMLSSVTPKPEPLNLKQVVKGKSEDIKRKKNDMKLQKRENVTLSWLRVSVQTTLGAWLHDLVLKFCQT